MRHIILNFHGLGAPPLPERETGEHRYWLPPEAFEDILALVAARRDRTRVTLTFDDGNQSDIEIAATALARHGRTATFFVLADRIDTPGNLSRDDIRTLISEGHRIGSHGAAHVDWTGLNAAGRARELTAARAEIAAIAGRPVTAAAIPFGRYNAAVLEGLRREGFEEAYSSDGGAVESLAWPLPRNSVRADTDIHAIAALLDGPDPALRSARRWLGRLRKRMM